ncbi:MAG: carbohydrate kinase family protein [Opitutaceae bacterium]
MPPNPSDSAPVYCFGHVSTGQILRLRGKYPEPNGYAEVVETAENYCGEATGTALVLQRLGIPTILEGNWLGDNPAGERTLSFLRNRGIDCSGLGIKAGYGGVNEVVITDPTSRTVFGRYVDLLSTTRQWEPPREESIQRSRCVCVDPGFGETSLEVARMALKHGIPLVTSDAAPGSPLTAGAAIIVVSKEGLSWHKLSADPRKAFEAYRAACPGLVVFTRGSESTWWARGAESGEVASFPIETMDTAGAGDSFRGGMIYGMLQGWTDERTVRFAVGVAALVCQSFPGVLGSPELRTVEAFLEAHPS